jgi:26S proteasome regulatory subunit N7
MSESSPLDALPSMAIAQLRERYASHRSPDDQSSLLTAVRENRMQKFYVELCQSFDWPVDSGLVQELSTLNSAEHAELQQKLADAREAQGEEDVRLAYQNLALFALRIADYSEIKEQLKALYSHTVALGQKIDVVFCQMRVSFFFRDHAAFKEFLDQAHTLVREGGDWERKNRLKVYEGLSLCLRRNFVAAAQLFISTLSTFTATELMDYSDFVYRTTVLAVLTLNRADFGSKIDRAMEVRAAGETVQNLLALYHLQYAEFLDGLAEVEQRMRSDIWFSRHLSYLIKELRVKAYRQFLEPYEAVQIELMAQAFRVTPEFIEGEVKRFIFTGKLNAKIDKVSGTIHTNPPDSRAAKMRQALKGGELLVTRLQKLGRILSA